METVVKVERIELEENRGALMVQPVTRSDLVRIGAAAQGDGVVAGMLLFRRAVVGAENVVRPDGEKAGTKPERHPQLGSLCHPDLFDSVTDAELARVTESAMRGVNALRELAEDAGKN